MSVFIYLLSIFLVVHCGSILVVGLVANYLIVIWFSYHFNYPHKSRDVPRFCFLIGVCYPVILSILSHEMCCGFVRNTWVHGPTIYDMLLQI